jgi:hypothetical protein
MPHKKTSPYWSHFQELNENGIKKAKCLVKTNDVECGTILIVKNTSCLKYHIEYKHKQIKVKDEELNEKKNDSKKSIKDAILAHSNNRYAKNSDRYNSLTNSVVSYIIAEKKAFDTVEKESFIRMLANFDKNYELPTRQSLSEKIIPRKFEDAKLILKEVLKNINSLAITCDGWTSLANNSYLGVTAHFINSEFKLDSLTLACKHMPISHTGENLANMLLQIFSDYSIEHKVTNIVCDGASNMIKLFEFAKKVIVF